MMMVCMEMVQLVMGFMEQQLMLMLRDVQYYFYAENMDAGIFSPERAEKEFHQLPVVGGLVINEIMAEMFCSCGSKWRV